MLYAPLHDRETEFDKQSRRELGRTSLIVHRLRPSHSLPSRALAAVPLRQAYSCNTATASVVSATPPISTSACATAIST
jgi:hypothetical protein